MPVRNPDSKVFPLALDTMRRLGDVVLLLDDNSSPSIASMNLEGVNEITTLSNSQEWDDYTNRMTLVLRAWAHRCNWILWVDADETVDTRLTRELARELCADAEAHGFN